MARTNTSKLHIAMFPWFATGHMTPFLHLSNELAKRGHRITYFLPKKAQLQLQHLNRYPHLITFHIVTVPQVDGLPPGTETASEIHISLNNLLVIATDQIRDQVELALSATKPDFVFYDSAHWIPESAKKFGIKTICYNVVCAASLAIALVPARNLPKYRPITEEELSQSPLGYPSTKVVLRGPQARSLLFISLPWGEGSTFYERITTALKESDAIAIRTTKEIEGSFCDYVASQYEKPVLLTGPVLPEEADGKLEERWANWLDGFEPGAVVFCAFGSQINLEKEQFQELLLGFELSGFPFLVSLKAPNGCETVEEGLPEGFEERVKGRGMVSRGWVQQPLILKHESVGCFVNHCGFGSMWESLMSDKQIVLVPFLGDQILNTKLLVEELEVAVEVERGENGWVSKESLCKAIKLVMDEGSDVGATLKKNHTKWKETKGSPKLMNGYIDRFIQDLQELPK
ncbi:UDP-glycosyltransferase 79B3-like [Gastrolobium bilobum]|uniref:UDP-glycosyltransferase 79B3-like n=1 Tax=Gastrolobium bilobum TaxID=150636 RepID=UPI002AAF6F31|nr:UDP-glycosyltransferase 79B3-like [Gastrolobium bilobum]